MRPSSTSNRAPRLTPGAPRFTLHNSRFTTAFTMVEMLTVIAIIAILAGILTPVLGTAKKKAKIAKAQTAISGLATAFTAYYTEYGKWPLDNTAILPRDVDDTMVKLLEGNGSLAAVSTSPFQGNPRNIVFMNFNKEDLDPSTGAFIDPWKHPYRCQFDVTYANSIANPFTLPLGTPNPIKAGSIIWSRGLDEKSSDTGGTGANIDADNIISW